MGYRSFDWQCTKCEEVVWDLVWVDETVPLMDDIYCDTCDGVYLHKRVLSLPAPYMGETDLSPQVMGGRYDTMGYKALPDLPMPENLPRDADVADRKARIDAYAQRFDSSEWKETVKERKCIQKENTAKKVRLEAKNRGENVNFRRDVLPGDPKVAS